MVNRTFTEDAELLEAIEKIKDKEDEAAFSRIVAMYDGATRKFFKERRFRSLAHRDESVIDEAVNEAWYRVATCIHKYEDRRGSFCAWFLKIADRCVYDIVRRYQAQREVPIGDYDFPTVADNDTREETIREFRAELSVALAHLTEMGRICTRTS